MLNFELKYRHKKFYDILYRGDYCYIIRIFYFYFALMHCKDNSILQKKNILNYFMKVLRNLTPIQLSSL